MLRSGGGMDEISAKNEGYRLLFVSLLVEQVQRRYDLEKLVPTEREVNQVFTWTSSVNPQIKPVGDFFDVAAEFFAIAIDHRHIAERR